MAARRIQKICSSLKWEIISQFEVLARHCIKYIMHNSCPKLQVEMTLHPLLGHGLGNPL